MSTKKEFRTNLTTARVLVMVESGIATTPAIAEAMAGTDLSYRTIQSSLSALRRDGFLKEAGLAHTGEPGQPSIINALTDKGCNWLADLREIVAQ